MGKERERQIEKLVVETRKVAAAKGVSQSQARREAFRTLANEQAKGGNG